MRSDFKCPHCGKEVFCYTRENEKHPRSCKRLYRVIKLVNKAEDNCRLAAMTRFWVRDTPKLNVWNYWWFRYFTNEFELYIMDAIEFEEAGDE